MRLNISTGRQQSENIYEPINGDVYALPTIGGVRSSNCQCRTSGGETSTLEEYQPNHVYDVIPEIIQPDGYEEIGRVESGDAVPQTIQREATSIQSLIGN